MGFNDFWINNNGKKEHLNNAKHGVRKEQVDKKFHNLFDAYDANGDGTLENEELGGIFKGLTKFAGADKTLDATENKQVANLFANQAGIENADFMGFVRSVSKATEDIVDSKETPTADGGREVKTTYKDGSVETISYYPDGEYKFKKLDQKGQNQSYYLIGNNTEKQFSAQEIENQLKTNYSKYLSNFKPGENKKPMAYQEFKTNSMSKFNIRKINSGFEIHNLDLSERAKKDIEVRDFVLNHYVETHKAAQEALESMGILDDVGAAINAGAGELWNSIKNVWNGTEEEYQNFYELSKKFEPNYNKALRTDDSLDVMRNNPEMFFRGFETDFKKDTGHKFDLQTASEFQETTERYQNATILNQRLDILKDAMSEIRSYQSEQDALVHAPAQNEGLNPASHIVKANKLLLQYFNNDQEAVDMILNGTIGNAEATIKAISGIKEETETQMKNIIGDRSYDDMKKEYETQYKAMYGTDFVPDELTDKVMDAKATGGMVKLAAITIVSILVTRSPIMAEISGAAAGSAEATGAAANLVRTLVTKYGQTAVQQGIKLAMTSGTLATDVGLTLMNQATSERGVNGEELWESTKGSAKYIFFGAYVGAPLAQAVSKSLGKIGATSRLFEGGTKTANGAIQTTSISGDKLIQNFVKGGNKVLTTGGAFLTDVAAFTGLEVATEGANLKDALSEQGQMLSKLKLMNHVLEYMLGAKTHTATSRANLDAAIEKSGVKNWNIKEIKTPQKTQYIVDIDGLPVGKFEDANQLATAMLERVTANYSESAKPQTKTQTTKPEGEVKATPETEVETKTARPESRINIPTGKLEAPNAKFAETDEAFRSIVTKRSADIKELDKINDIDEFCRKSFELMKEEMGLEDSDIKLEITDKNNYYDHETNTVYISRNWAGKEKGHVKGKGDKAEIFGGMAHELNHYLQWKEIVLNFDSENPNWNNIISYLQQFEGAQKNIEYLIEKYPDNTELKEFFEKAKSYQDNWLNYTDAFDESGKLKTGAEYDKYRNQTVEAESFRRGDIVAEEYRKAVADVKPEGVKENPLLTRLETANDRESFVTIRDEIKKMPNGEQKTQMMQAYLKKYNEWSADPSRPDIRMQYMPEKENAGNTQTDIYNLKSIDGYIDENTQVSEQTRNNITTLLNNSVDDPMIADMLLENIPNEHCAKVLESYISKYAGSKDLMRLPLGLDGAESVKGFVKLLKNTKTEIKPFQVMNIERYGFDKYLELEQNGYLPPAIRSFDSEAFKSMDKIEDPVVRHRLHKLYASKIFSRNDFYKLYQMRNQEIDFDKLDRLDSICDELGVFDELSTGHCERLLQLPNEKIDIIEQRGLLKKVPNRERKLTGADVFELLEVDDATWDIIQKRNLLADIPERENKYAKSLPASDAILYSELTDTEWQRIKDMGLLYKEYDNNHNSHSIYATGDRYSSARDNILMAKMTNVQKEAFERYQKMGKQGDSQMLFDTSQSLKLASLPDAKREFIEKVMNMQDQDGQKFFNDGYQICMLTDLSDEQIAKAQQRGLFDVMTINRYGSEKPAIFDAYAIKKLSALSDATWQRLEKLGLEGTKKYEGYQTLADFTPEEWDKLPENIQDVDNFQTLSAAIKMDDKAWNRYKSDFMRKLDFYTDEYSIEKILQLDDAQYTKLQELAKREDRGKTKLSMKLSTQDLLLLSSLDDKAFERVKNDLFHIEGFMQELPVDNMIKLAVLDDAKYKFFVDNYLSAAAEQNILSNINFDHAFKFTNYLADKKLNYSKEEMFKLMNAPLREETIPFAVKMCTDSDMKIPFTTQAYQTRRLGENELVLDILKVFENSTEANANPEIIETLLKDTDIKNNPLLVNILPKLVGFISKENYSNVKELFTNLSKDNNLTYEGLDYIVSKFYGDRFRGAISKADRAEKISLALELAKDPNFPNEMIASSITNSHFDYDAHKEFAPQSDFAYKVKKVREFRDSILNDPNLVKDGGYASLEIAQDEIKTRFYNCFSAYMKNFDIAESMLAKENPPSKFDVMEIMQATWEGNEAVSRKLCEEYDKIGINPKQITSILHNIRNDNQDEALKLLENYKKMEIAPSQITVLLDFDNNVSYKQIKALNNKMGRHKAGALEHKDLLVACKFPDLYGVKNINEIPISGKKELLHNLVSSNTGLFEISDKMSQDFPLIPRNQEEYCSLLPSIVRSLGIETNELTPEQRITMFNSSMGELSKSLAELSDTDFSKMTITQEYPKDKFILDVLDKVKALPRTERQKVYDYFGFELHHNKENGTGFSITGYPVNLNNGKKLAQIEDPRTKAVVESLRPDVVRFSENNKIKCNNPKVEQFLNEVIEALPELRTTIGKKQHGNGENYGHDFDIMQHSLKVMQKVAQDPKFATLNESDQKIMLLASLMHDITKSEGRVDKTHANYGSFDSFFIAQKFNLSKEEEVKLHTVIKQHEWLEYVNSAKSPEQLTKRLQSVAYDLHQGNLFDMAEIFTHADLKAVKVDDSFHDTTEGKSRIGFDGTVRSFGESANIYAERIRGYIKELQKSQPLLPQTKIPRASKINDAITQVNSDGSTNIKGVYKDKDGLVIIKFNEVEDWEAIGFPKGSISHGIEIKKGEKGDAELSEDVNTGNIKFFVHALEYSNQLAKFDAFSLVDSDALLSVSYAERPESKYRFFRSQGVLLDVNSKYIHGGGNHDSGSGYGKDITEFKNNYIFGGKRQKERTYVSDLIKEVTGMTDEQYIEFVEVNKDRPIQDIEPAEIRDKIVKAFATINSNTRKGKREYNEMYISNPNEVMGVFAYNINYNENIENPVDFLNRTTIGKYERGAGANGKDISVKERTEFLRQYALERDLPFIIFGD